MAVEASPAVSRVSATGNRFTLWDAFVEPAPDDLAATARRLCAEQDTDGLAVLAPDREADARMVFLNPDGSRAETCGNALRALAATMHRRGRAPKGELVFLTDAGPSVARVRRAKGEVRASISFPDPRELRTLDLREPGVAAAVFVDLGNPHCVLLGAPELLDRLPELGPRFERDPRFPRRTNVELVSLPEPASARAAARVWERGVGETASCGSGATAVALALRHGGHAELPVTVVMPGGELRIDRDESGIRLEGAVEES